MRGTAKGGDVIRVDPIKLDSISQIPDGFLGVLESFEQVIQRSEYLDDLLEHNELLKVAKALDQVCLEKGIVGIHYTKAIRTEIESSGLQPSSGDARRRAFLDQFGHRFTDVQIAGINQIWEKYFSSRQRGVRDNLIWFAFTLAALENGGASRLLTYFGGEQIYMPLTEAREIGAILKTFGEPMIVRCSLDPSNLKTFSEYPWGKIWLSTYHRSRNPNAHQFDVDAYQTQAVLPADIVISKPNVDWLP